MARIRRVYGKNLDIIFQSKNISKFKIKNKTGEGQISVFNIYKGIYVTFNDIHMEKYKSDGSLSGENIVEISHCREGRFECSFDGKKYIYLSQGDLCMVKLRENREDESYFPISHYHGVSIFLFLDELKDSELLKEFRIDIEKIYNLVSKPSLRIYRSNESLEHIFYEFYQKENSFQEEYLKVKVIELLLFITNLDWRKERQKKVYIPAQRVKKLKLIKDFLVKNLSTHYTIDEICIKFNMGATSLKEGFKFLYGDTIYNYTKKLRLEKAKQLLKQGRLSIAEIALEVGYLNPAKFSTAFKKEYGIAPSKFND